MKALVLNETRDKFLVVQEENGLWEFPGGGLDWDMSPQEDLPREIDEEMGLTVTSIAEHPCYFLTMKRRGEDSQPFVANIFYETTLEDLDFTPSEECVAVRFVSKEEARELEAFPNVERMAEMFDPARHQ